MRVAPPDNHLARHARLRAELSAASLDTLLVTSLPNIAYLTGLFASTAALIVGSNGLHLIVDGRYLGSAQLRQRDLPGMQIVLVPPAGSFEETVAGELLAASNGRAGFEADHLTVRQHQDLAGRLARSGATTHLEGTQGLVERLRAVKDDWELATLKDAATRLSDAAKCIIPKALAGMAEREVAGIIEAQLRRVGFDKPAFDTIVAAGPNSAVPHYRAGGRRLSEGDLVVMDFGGMLDGYAVDLTRTITVGRPRERERQLLEQVAAAQAAAFAAIGIGKAATAVDAAARRALEGAGLGDAFSHGTGHGLGLEIHERPRVGRWRADLADEALQAGMVFTLEPGAYLAGWGGARIEDDVVVTSGGAEWLTDVPRLL
ncbi:MAG: Xaa-Pro peptidase family protein [Acidobacteriota bacterium]|nr:Xaa-Pro peptidase family protein [Acidobacteriota bacterium]